jgi:hypothetical protein
LKAHITESKTNLNCSGGIFRNAGKDTEICVHTALIAVGAFKKFTRPDTEIYICTFSAIQK